MVQIHLNPNSLHGRWLAPTLLAGFVREIFNKLCLFSPISPSQKKMLLHLVEVRQSIDALEATSLIKRTIVLRKELPFA